jgi:hypothetical protein
MTSPSPILNSLLLDIVEKNFVSPSAINPLAGVVSYDQLAVEPRVMSPDEARREQPNSPELPPPIDSLGRRA